MPTFFLRPCDAVSRPFKFDGDLYEVLVSCPFPSRHRVSQIAHVSPTLPNTFVGSEAARDFGIVPLKRRRGDSISPGLQTGEIHLCIRNLDALGRHFAQTDPLTFKATVSPLLADGHIVLGWTELMKSFEDRGLFQNWRHLEISRTMRSKLDCYEVSWA